MTHRSVSHRLIATGAGALMMAGIGLSARAAETMSAADFMKAVNANADKTISMEELDTYAKKRFAALESDNDKTLNDKELKGRLTEAGMNMADADKDKTVDEKEFVDYAHKLFAEANVHKKEGGDHPTLSVEELGTPAGQKLITLLH